MTSSWPEARAVKYTDIFWNLSNSIGLSFSTRPVMWYIILNIHTIYVPFLSFLDTETAQVAERFPHGRQAAIYPTKWILWMLMLFLGAQPTLVGNLIFKMYIRCYFKDDRRKKLRKPSAVSIILCAWYTARVLVWCCRYQVHGWKSHKCEKIGSLSITLNIVVNSLCPYLLQINWPVGSVDLPLSKGMLKLMAVKVCVKYSMSELWCE